MHSLNVLCVCKFLLICKVVNWNRNFLLFGRRTMRYSPYVNFVLSLHLYSLEVNMFEVSSFIRRTVCWSCYMLSLFNPPPTGMESRKLIYSMLQCERCRLIKFVFSTNILNSDYVCFSYRYHVDFTQDTKILLSFIGYHSLVIHLFL